MIKLTLASSLEQACTFIDNRLAPLLGQHKLRQTSSPHGLKVLLKEEHRLKEIDNAIVYTDKTTDKVSLIIVGNEADSSKVKTQYFGVTLRKKGDAELDFYVDTLDEAFKKGLLNPEIKRGVFNNKAIGIALVVLLLLGIVVSTGGLALFLIILLTVVLYPIQYLVNKRKFVKLQERINTLASIFQAELQGSNRIDTKDSMTFFGKVTSNAGDVLRDLSPLNH